MRIIILLIAFSFVGCATQAQTAKEFAFDNWVHHTDEKYDVELVYSVSKNLVYWATTTSSSAMETAAELWTDQVVQDVIYSSDGTIKDGNWIGLPYAWAHGRTIYWWVHESVLGQIILPPEL